MNYDVIIVGGGHAGVEAAAAAARLGVSTLLVTHHAKTVGSMSCNPAIGGIGKGHLVREIDALDGVMGIAADAASIQYRVLNRRKGAAVQGLRAQIDRQLYAAFIQKHLASLPHLEVMEGDVQDLMCEASLCSGVVLADGRQLKAASVVITTGTFLAGVIHIGDERQSGGRFGEAAAVGLSAALRRCGLVLGRLKTGTPARLDRKTIDYSALDVQPADECPSFFSYMTNGVQCRQVECHITKTTPETHQIIRDNIHRSAMYSGTIEGVGPRYCPSIEDKIVRFGERDGHQIFLEPEGLEDDLIYPNGISTSLPTDVQEQFIRSIPGLENVRIVRYGYAIEYDHIDPRQLDVSLQCRAISGLFFAGQINGTTGYEEAGAQGLIAGLNAARLAQGLDLCQLDRTNSYIGVMIDDLISRGISEPYRMFTSRAEFRLSLRGDNADQRLTPIGIRFGCVSSERQALYAEKEQALREAMILLGSLWMTPNEAAGAGIRVNQDGVKRSGWDYLASGNCTIEQLRACWPQLSAIKSDIAAQLEIEALYSVYVARQAEEIRLLQRETDIQLRSDFDYKNVAGLSNELQQKLSLRKPATLQQAMAIEGMTPAAGVLLLALHKKR